MNIRAKLSLQVVAIIAGTSLVIGGVVGAVVEHTQSTSNSFTNTAATPPGYSVTDSQCLAAETTCAMNFQNDATKDLDPFTGLSFDDPKPGLRTGFTDAQLTAITKMPTCAGASPFHNCRPAGYTTGKMTLSSPANNKQTYYFDNCIINSPITMGPGGGAVVPGLAVYITNCHVAETGDNGGSGYIGNGAGGGLYMLHDLLDGSAAPNTTHPVIVQAQDPGITSHIYYSEFSQNTDQAGLGASVDFEWNYMHNSRCDKSVTPACQHTDGGPEVYGGGTPATSAAHPITIANNYFSCLCDSTGGPANITTDYGNNGYIFVLNNKALPTYGSGYNSQGIIVQQNTAYTATLTNVHIVGNTFFASSSHPPSIMGFGGSICSKPIPNTCISEISGNTQVSATGVVSTWQSQPAAPAGNPVVTTTTIVPTTTTTAAPTTTTLAPTTTVAPTTIPPTTTTPPTNAPTTTTVAPVTPTTTSQTIICHSPPLVCTVAPGT